MTDTKTRTRPAAVTLTANAEARIAKLMADAPADAIGVKLSTPRRGCSGLRRLGLAACGLWLASSPL